MCQFSLRNRTRDAVQGEQLVVGQFSHSRAFKGVHDNNAVCTREGHGLLVNNASPELQLLAGINSTEFRAIYENPNGMSHEHDSSKGDGLRFYNSDGQAANFVRFDELPVGTTAQVAFTEKDAPEWPAAETAGVHEEELVHVRS